MALKRIYQGSLKTRLTLAMLGIFLLSTWSLAFYASQMLREDMQALLGKQQASTVALLAANVNHELDSRLRALEKMAGRVSPAIFDNAARLQTFLEDRPELQSLFNGGLVVFRSDGNAIAEVPLSVGRIGANYLDVQAVAAALKTGKSTIGSPMISKKLQAPVFGMTVPIRDAQGQVIGALAGVTNLSLPNFLDGLTEGRYGQRGYYLLEEPKGRMIITGTDKRRVMQPLPAPGVNRLIDRHVAGFDDTGVTVNPVGVEVLASAARVAVTGWFLVGALPTAEAFAPIQALQQRMLLATLLLTLLAGGLTWWMLRRQLAPLLATATTLADLSQSRQPPQPLAVTRQDEIGQLIGGFNRLLASLGQREALLKQILDTSSVAIFLVDKEGRITQANQRMAEMFGCALEALHGREYFSLVHPSEREIGHQNMLALLASESASVDLDRRYRRADDSEFWGHLTGRRFIDANGVADGLIGTIADITERKQADHERDLSEQNLAITLQSIGDAVIATDVAGRITRMNATAEQLTGWTLAEALGRPLPEVFHIVNALTRALADNPVHRVLAHGQIVGLANHTALLARDGREYQIFDSAAPIRDADGHLLGVVLVFSDVTEDYRVRQELERTTALLERTGEMAKIGGWELELASQQLTWSAENHRIHEVELTETITLAQALDFFTAEARTMVQAAHQAAIDHGTPWDLELPLITAKGRHIWVRDQGVAVLANGRAIRLQGALQDITERKQAEASLRVAATAFEAQEAIIVTDARQVILKVNAAFSRITGYSAAEAVGQTPALLKSGRHNPAFYQAMWESLHHHHFWQGEIWNRRKNGELYPERMAISAVLDEAGQVSNYVGTFSDLTEQRQAQEQIERLAFTDALTELPNRRLLIDRLRQAMLTARRTSQHGALLFLDLDHFKQINDTLGHDLGDLLLQQVAARLQACVRQGDSIARMGGDEFVLLLENLSSEASEAATQVEVVASKILEALRQPYTLRGHPHASSASIGIALFLGSEYAVEELLKKADIAMYQAKAAGRNASRFFDASMQALAQARVELEQDLRRGLVHDEFVLHYQLQVNSAGAPIGAEALVRWNHATRGMVAPGQFIALAEETGLILPLGQWVLERACAELLQWATQPETARWTMAVNVSSVQFAQTDFVASVEQALARTGANPGRLKLELTESMLLNDVQDVIAKMSALKALGVCFSLDDFGTGYSSLSYLKRLPLDQLKIDQSFVSDLLTDVNDAMIARTIVALGHSLGLTVIAEGVETQGQRDFLASIGCDAFQGYYFARPLGDIEAALKTLPSCSPVS